MAFKDADPLDRQAYDRVILGYFDHRESMPKYSWLAVVDDSPAGACLVSMRHYYSSERDYPYVDMIAVNPQFRARGLGCALLSQALDSLVAAGHRSIVHAHIRRGNTASERLFAGRGFLRWFRDD
jgi:L-amino acid N-acyltransferase YncA